VKRIVEQHEGVVKVTSEEGKGSCFWVELPCVITSDTFDQGMALENQAGLAPTILLIEPDEAELMTISNYLEAKGYHLQLAQTSEQALATLKSQVPHLVVFTWEGSEEQGLAVMQSIRESSESESLPIIAIAPQTLSGQYQWQTETIHCLSKPVKLKSLAKMIQETLN
jgi:response regulator RpfG family c-di-GMP phosphodiesterase